MTREEILKEVFKSIVSYMPMSSYAFKGGYILKIILGGEWEDIRRTTDIDLSIGRIDYFDKIVEIIEPLAKEWVSTGSIYSYKINRPKENSTGNIKFYKKFSENTKAFVYCGIDIDLHPVNYGIIMLTGGGSAYSVERMLAEKFWAMYASNEKILVHRIKDVLDIYLLEEYNRQNHVVLKEFLLIRCIQELMVKKGYQELKNASQLELVLMKDMRGVLCALDKEINSRLSKSIVGYIKSEVVLLKAVIFMNYVRGLVNVNLLG